MKQVIKKKIAEANNIETEKPIYTLILDMNSIAKQSLVDKRMSSKGKEYGMVYQSIIAIGNVITKYDFNFCYGFWDGDNSGQLRAYIYPEYKANRDKNYAKSEYDKKIDDFAKRVIAYSKAKKNKQVDLRESDETEDESFARQRELLFQILENLFVRQAIYDDVEGDDLIAYYVKNKKPNEKIVIVSRDRDLTQLIADDVSVYILDMKKFISPKNHIKELGYTHENVLLKKIFCGDGSDNIKGVKGLGEKTFFGLFPEAVERKLSVDDIITTAKQINEQRAKNKQKPLKSCSNIIDGVTDGCQGNKIYEVNRKIIDLSEPLLTEDAQIGLEELMYAPLDPEDREITNIYQLIQDEGMIDMFKEDKFSTMFAPFAKLIDNEKKYKG